MFAAPGAPPALREAAARRGLTLVAAPDAAAAGVMAAVTGQLTDAPGAALAPLGDAAALAPGLALAARDRAPLVVLTEAHADAALLAPVVKASLVAESASAGHWIAHAANLALTAPRGPVHVACAAASADAPALPVAAACRPAPLPPPPAEALDALARALAAATRPLVVTGLECGGDDAKWLRAFAESLPAAVLATPTGRGVLADPHPLALGLLDAHHPLLARADLILLVGVDAGELAPGALPPAAAVARLARSPWPAGRRALAADVTGDIALVIEELAPRVRARPAADWNVAELDRVKRAIVREAAATPAARLVQLAREAMPGGTVATADVALPGSWQAVAPREVLTPVGGHATPGYAVLAAVAAQLADADRRVVAFTTTAGLAAGARGLALARELALPIVVVVLDGRLDEAAAAGELARAFPPRRPVVVGAAEDAQFTLGA